MSNTGHPQLAARVRTGETTATALLEDADRIDRHDGSLQCFQDTFADTARA